MSRLAPLVLIAACLGAACLGAACLGAGCSGTPHRASEPDPEPPARVEMDAGVDAPSGPVVYEDTAAPDGAPCTSSPECSAGMCRGAPGCTSEWACGEAIACGDDRIAYCDCEGVTFYALSGCAGRPYQHVGACDSGALAEVEFGLPRGDEPITSEDRICETADDCRRGEVCYGPSGCGVTLRCQRVRGCAGPRATFCGCDGETFEASIACPGRSYLRRGECEGMLASADPPVAAAGRPDAGVAAAVRPDAGTAIASSRPDAGVVVVAAAPDAGARWTSTVTAEGEHTCRTNRDCRRPEVCMGTGGCGETWTCQRPPEACMRDTQYFCDCAGRSFTASMNCPGRLYAHRGSCAIDEYIELSGGATH